MAQNGKLRNDPLGKTRSIQVGLPTYRKQTKQIKSYLKSWAVAEVLPFCCGDERVMQNGTTRRDMNIHTGNNGNLKGFVKEI